MASSVAIAAMEAGERVFIIDMDPQQSLIKWSKERGENDIAVESVTAAKLPAVLTALARQGITLVIIDTPGGESAAAEAAIKASDLCIIPARPNVFDIWSSEATRTLAKNLKRDYVFLLNQCPPAQQSARVEDGASALEAMGGLLNPLVSARADFQDAARNGLGVTEWAPSGVAAGETRKLWASIRRRIGKMTKAPAKAGPVKAAPKKKAA